MNKSQNRSHEIAMTLLEMSPSPGEPARVEALTHLVIGLLQEVEALRLLAMRTNPQEYAKAYEAAAELANNSAGITTGLEKLIALYCNDHEAGQRELLLLHRLGYSSGELRRFADVLEHARALT
jgi:hypothetical protein